MGDKWRAGELSEEDIEDLRDELDAVAAKTRLPRKLKTLRKALAGADAAHRPAETSPAPIAPAAAATPAAGPA